MSQWVLEDQPEMVEVPIDPKIYNEHLAQIAKILYSAFCQLDPKTQPIAIPTSLNSRTFNQEVTQ